MPHLSPGLGSGILSPYFLPTLARPRWVTFREGCPGYRQSLPGLCPCQVGTGPASPCLIPPLSLGKLRPSGLVSTARPLGKWVDSISIYFYLVTGKIFAGGEGDYAIFCGPRPTPTLLGALISFSGKQTQGTVCVGYHETQHMAGVLVTSSKGHRPPPPCPGMGPGTILDSCRGHYLECLLYAYGSFTHLSCLLGFELEASMQHSTSTFLCWVFSK